MYSPSIRLALDPSRFSEESETLFIGLLENLACFVWAFWKKDESEKRVLGTPFLCRFRRFSYTKVSSLFFERQELKNRDAFSRSSKVSSFKVCAMTEKYEIYVQVANRDSGRSGEPMSGSSFRFEIPFERRSTKKFFDLKGCKTRFVSLFGGFFVPFFAGYCLSVRKILPF